MQSAPTMHASNRRASPRRSTDPTERQAARRRHQLARPKGVALPSMDQMDATHQQILLALDALEGLLEQGSALQAPETVRKACAFFSVQARAHHDAEEAYVFPAVLKDASPELLAHVRHLQHDHNWIEEDWLELEPHLLALAEGWRQEHIDFLRAALPEFTDLVRAHIALEEAVIYPVARRGALAVPGG